MIAAILRLKASEDDVYRLMDRREHCCLAVALCSIAEGVCMYLLIYQKRCWDLAYLCSVLGATIVLLIWQVHRCGKRIMEAEHCYLELDESSLAVCQPEKTDIMRPAVFSMTRSKRLWKEAGEVCRSFILYSGSRITNGKALSFWMMRSSSGIYSVSVPLGTATLRLPIFTGNCGGWYQARLGLSVPGNRKYGT